MKIIIAKVQFLIFLSPAGLVDVQMKVSTGNGSIVAFEVIKIISDGMQFEYLLSMKDEKKQNYIRSRIEGAGNFFKISNPQIDCFGFCLSEQSR